MSLKVVGITRVRNEKKTLINTLNHVSKLCDYIIAYDDASEDETVQILKNHKSVSEVYRNFNWSTEPSERNRLNGVHRNFLFNKTKKYNPDWVYVFDADEIIDLDFVNREFLKTTKADVIAPKFIDFYITKKDIDVHYLSRQYCGVEFREIITLFKPNNLITFPHREPFIPNKKNIYRDCFVKHYGKAIDLESWKKKCHYYINYMNQYDYFLNESLSDKWRKRIDKAIHSKSDFNTELVTYKEIVSGKVKLKKIN